MVKVAKLEVYVIKDCVGPFVRIIKRSKRIVDIMYERHRSHLCATRCGGVSERT